jgi:peptidoglycan/xylan/chitin deacetylase (PgdA/CDA1 family)
VLTMFTPKMRSALATVALIAALFIAEGSSIAAQSAGVPNLLYHRISTSSSPLPIDDTTADIQSFSEQMRYLHDSGYRTLSTSELVRRLRSREDLPPKVVSIHFDDGWRSVLAAVPVLKQYHFGATFWLIVEAIGQPEYLTWDDVAKLASNPEFEFQSHTMTHPWHDGNDLQAWAERNSVEDKKQIQWELRESKVELERKLKRKVDLLAWPKGAYNDRLIKDAARAGYLGLFTVEWGLTRSGQDPLRIPRSYVGGRCDLDAFKQILADGHSRQCLERAAQRER